MEVNIDMEKFINRFSEIHTELYDSNDDRDDFDEAVSAYDEALKNPTFRDFLGEFVGCSGNVISTNRECAAFMYAFNESVAESLYGDDEDEEL